MRKPAEESLDERLGFTSGRGGAHLARTMMSGELATLLEHVPDTNATQATYRRAVIGDNCLQKPSGRARALSYKYLASLYALDPAVPLFRTLRYFWLRDAESRALLSLLCAYARDAILRQSASLVLGLPTGVALTRVAMEQHIDSQTPGRFSHAMLKSAAQNVNGTWTSSGHLTGKVHKVRSIARATPGSVAYALYLSYLRGERAMRLFGTEYIKLLDCSPEQAMELAATAGRRGWLVFKRIDDVVEVRFPALITARESEWLGE